MIDKRPTGRRVKYPGITRHARKLGVTYPHLWQVLTGRRQSKRLMSGYVRLIREERGEQG